MSRRRRDRSLSPRNVFDVVASGDAIPPVGVTTSHRSRVTHDMEALLHGNTTGNDSLLRHMQHLQRSLGRFITKVEHNNSRLVLTHIESERLLGDILTTKMYIKWWHKEISYRIRDVYNNQSSEDGDSPPDDDYGDDDDTTTTITTQTPTTDEVVVTSAVLSNDAPATQQP